MDEILNKRIIWVGLFILIGLAFLLAAILMIGNLHQTFENKMKLITHFDNISGLQKGDNVWFSGVKIGTVGKIVIDKNMLVVVELKIEKDAQNYLRKDAVAKVSTDGFIGNQIVVLSGGSPSSDMIEEGDVLKSEKTFSTENLMRSLKKNNDQLLNITHNIEIVSQKLLSNEGTLGQLINDKSLYDHINSITVSLNDYSAKFNKKGTLANELVSDTTVFHSLKKSAAQLQQITQNADELMNSLKKATNNPKTPFGVLFQDEESGAELKRSIKNLETATELLNEDLKAAQHNFLLRGYFKDKEKKAKEGEKESKSVNTYP